MDSPLPSSSSLRSAQPNFLPSAASNPFYNAALERITGNQELPSLYRGIATVTGTKTKSERPIAQQKPGTCDKRAAGPTRSFVVIIKSSCPSWMLG
jgi:hypothetical protein